MIPLALAAGWTLAAVLARPVPPPRARAQACARGRVTLAGEPVRASVFGIGWQEEETVSEADLEDLPFRTLHGYVAEGGRFSIPIRAGGPFEIFAWARGLGSTRRGPIELDAARGLDGLELALGPPGAVEGRVRLPEGHGPWEIYLDVPPGLMRLRPDGSFRLPDLPADAGRSASSGPASARTTAARATPTTRSSPTGRCVRRPGSCPSPPSSSTSSPARPCGSTSTSRPRSRAGSRAG